MKELELLLLLLKGVRLFVIMDDELWLLLLLLIAEESSLKLSKGGRGAAMLHRVTEREARAKGAQS